MTSPVPGTGGFRVAEGFIDVKTRVDRMQVNRAGREAGGDFADRVVETARDRIDRRKDLIARELAKIGDHSGTKAGERFAEGFFRDSQGRLRDRRGRFAAMTDGIEQVGQDAGRQFANGFVNLVTGNTAAALKSPPFAATLVSAIVAVSPLLASAVSGALISGIGLAGIGLGLAAAFTDAEGPARAALSKLGKRLGEDWRKMGDMFQGVAVEAVGILGEEWDKRLPDMMRGLESLLGFVEPVTRGVARFMGEIISGLSTVMERAGPLLLVFEQELGETGEAIRRFLEMITEDTDGAVMGLKIIFELLQGTFLALGLIISGLTASFEGLVAIFDLMYDKMLLNHEAAGVLALPLLATAAAADKLIGYLDEINGQSSEYGRAARYASTATDAWGNSLGMLRGKTADNVTQQDLLNASMNESVKVVGDLTRVLDILNGRALDARAAESAYQAAVDDATAALTKRVDIIDLNTELGREYDQNLRNIVLTSQQVADAAYQQAAAEGNVEAAELAAAIAMQRGRDQLIALARHYGLSEAAAKEYADQIMKIPPKWATFLNNNAKVVRDDASNYKKVIDSIPTDVYTYFHARAVEGFGSRYDSWGGVHQAANGMVASILTSPTVIAGERDTEKEAYIPKRGNLQRSRQILSEAASWLGMRAIPDNNNRNARMSHVGAGGSEAGVGGGAQGQPIYVTAVFPFPEGEVRRTVRGVITKESALVAAVGIEGSRRVNWLSNATREM